MNRLPPDLLYLTIYNPALQPSDPNTLDDDDAGEQAQILFYTSRDRAVSRDKVLRQVGLAKALVNFSSMLDPGSICENVHSQTRRMVMVSPEPDFWIHACVEVAKMPRPVISKAKAKSKGKENDLPSKQEVAYDYLDGSVRDIALRSYILESYEQFKLTHGSFTSILNSLGQQALELQLERFFTVWTWKCDFRVDRDFAAHLGMPLHPLQERLAPILDNFASTSASLGDNAIFALIPPYVVASTITMNSKFPSVLFRHVMSRVPPPPLLTPQEPIDGTGVADELSEHKPGTTGNDDALNKPSPIAAPSSSDSKRARNFSMGLNVDMRNLKWGWPGYLSFGKSGKSSPLQVPSSPSHTPEGTDQKPMESKPPSPVPLNIAPEVDTELLQDAMSSHQPHTPPSPIVTRPFTPPPPSATSGNEGAGVPFPEHESLPVQSADDPDGPERGSEPVPFPVAESEETITPPREPEVPIMPKPLPSLLKSPVYLADSRNPTATTRKMVLHMTDDRVTVAMVVDLDHTLDLDTVSEGAVQLINSLQDAVDSEESNGLETSIPTVSKILEPKDKYIITQNDFTTCPAPGFTSQSDLLFNGQQLLRSDLDVLEVFSRGQNPQHWHLSRRGLGTDKEGNALSGEVFMEIARKESTLSDVDNELAGVMRRFLE